MFDTAAFEAAFKEALPAEHHAIEKKVAEKHALMGVPAPFLDAKDFSAASFCSLWPKIEGFLNVAIGAIGWFRPTEAAQAKAFIAALKKTVLPLICPVA